MKSLNQVSPAGNYRDVVFNASDWVDAYVSTGAARTFTKTTDYPTEAEVVVFSATGNFYVNFAGDTAAAPAAHVTDGTGSVLNPTSRYVRGMSSFSVFAPAGTIVTMAFYTVQ